MEVGLALLGATAVGVAIHGAATAASRWIQRRGDRNSEPLAAFGDPDKVWLPMPGMRDASAEPSAAPETDTQAKDL